MAFDPGSFGSGLLQGAAAARLIRGQQRDVARDAENDRRFEIQDRRAQETHDRNNRALDFQFSEQQNARSASQIGAHLSQHGSLDNATPEQRIEWMNQTGRARGLLDENFTITDIARAEDGTEVIIGSGTRADGSKFENKPLSQGGGTDDDPIVFKPGSINELLVGHAGQYDAPTRARLQADTDRVQAVDRISGLQGAAQSPSHQVPSVQPQGQEAPIQAGQGSPAPAEGTVLSGAAWTAPNGRTVAPMPAPLAPLASAAGQKYGLSGAGIAAQAGWESNYKPDSVSPSGQHIGIGQIGKAVADNHGVAHEQVRDPAVAFDVMGAEMSRLRDQYDGNMVLALAAYNAGPEKANEWRQRFGDGITPEQITFKETREYVEAVLPHYEQGDQAPSGQALSGAAAQAPVQGPTQQPVAAATPPAAATAAPAGGLYGNDATTAARQTRGIGQVIAESGVGQAVANVFDIGGKRDAKARSEQWDRVADPNNEDYAQTRQNLREPGEEPGVSVPGSPVAASADGNPFRARYIEELDSISPETRAKLDPLVLEGIEAEMVVLNEEAATFPEGFGDQPRAVREASGNHKENDRYQRNLARRKELLQAKFELGATAPRTFDEDQPPGEEVAAAATARADTVPPPPMDNDQLVEAQQVVAGGIGQPKLTPEQIDNAIWLKQRGLLTEEVFQRYISTGDIRKSDITQTDPKKDTWRVYEDGSRVLIHAGESAANGMTPAQMGTALRARFKITVANQNWMQDTLETFIPYEEGTPQYAQAMASFYASLNTNAADAARKGFDLQGMLSGENFDRSQVTTYMGAWARAYGEHRGYESSWWDRTFKSRPTTQPTDLLPDPPADYQATGQVNVAGARQAMLATEDPQLIELANTLDDEQLAEFVRTQAQQ